MTTIGTVQTKYGKQWIYLNPDPLFGPDAWAVASFEVNAGTQNLLGIPPIMVDQQGADVTMTYSIVDLKGLDEVNRKLLASEVPAVPQSTLTNIVKVEGAVPVYTNSVGLDTLIYFNIQELQAVETRALNQSDTSRYNSNSIASLTTELPLEAFEIQGVATVFFDITTLQDA